MNPTGESPEQLMARIAELERELARVQTERDLFKQTLYAELMASDPYVPMTLEEARELMSAQQGERIEEIVSEFEKELAESE